MFLARQRDMDKILLWVPNKLAKIIIVDLEQVECVFYLIGAGEIAGG